MKTFQQNVSLSFIQNHAKLFAILLSVFTLIGCSSETNQSQSSNITLPSIKNSNLSDDLKTSYLQTCAVCHTKRTTGAPLAGDKEQWKKILSKGMDQVLERVINGYGGMPPGGQCFECSPEQLAELVLFMAQSRSETEALR